MTREIQLTKGQIALVDNQDYEHLTQRGWYARWDEDTKSFYAYTTIRDSKTTQQKVYMHRMLLGIRFGDKRQVDHVNHDTLDNRRENLKIVTNRENAENRRDQSKHGVGVSFDRRRKARPFYAHASLDGKKIHIGSFATAKEASTARTKFLKYHGITK